MMRHTRAQLEIDAAVAVEEDPQGWGTPAADPLDGQHLDAGLQPGKALFDLRLNVGWIVASQSLICW